MISACLWCSYDRAFPIFLDLIVAWEVLIASVWSTEAIPVESDIHQCFLAVLLRALLGFLGRDFFRLCGISNKSDVCSVNAMALQSIWQTTIPTEFCFRVVWRWISGGGGVWIIAEGGWEWEHGVMPLVLFLYILGILHDKKCVCVCVYDTFSFLNTKKFQLNFKTAAF